MKVRSSCFFSVASYNVHHSGFGHGDNDKESGKKNWIVRCNTFTSFIQFLFIASSLSISFPLQKEDDILRSWIKRKWERLKFHSLHIRSHHHTHWRVAWTFRVHWSLTRFFFFLYRFLRMRTPVFGKTNLRTGFGTQWTSVNSLIVLQSFLLESWEADHFLGTREQ